MKSSAILIVLLFFGARSAFGQADLPPERPLYQEGTRPDRIIQYDAPERVREVRVSPDAPSASNRVFSMVSQPTYSIHRPEKPNGVGLVICPGGGYRDVWLDREGHDLAIWLKQHGITSLVLKYRTNANSGSGRAYPWKEYLPAVEADARQAIRILRSNADQYRLKPNKIGICGFSAGGNLAILATLHSEPKSTNPGVSGMPDFAGLFYPWLREDYSDIIKSRSAPESATQKICPVFIMNAADDRVTPAKDCVEFYTQLTNAGVPTEIHIFSKGSHGFDLGKGRGQSAAIWPSSFVAWLKDSRISER